MAFVSIINGGGRGRKRTTSGISIKYSKSGSMQCYVGVDIRANNRFIFVEIDEETKQKSLRTIKKQSERLSRMVEDLLVVPDIEGERIRTNIEPLWLSKILESAIALVSFEISPNVEAIPSDAESYPAEVSKSEKLSVDNPPEKAEDILSSIPFPKS